MVYEIKGQNTTDPGQVNYRILTSPDKRFFYWNDRKFKNLKSGDVVFVVNKTGREVLHAELEAADKSSNLHRQKATASEIPWQPAD